MSDVVLAVDLGGTNIRMAAVTAEGGILALVREATPKNVSPETLIGLTAQLADECQGSLPADTKAIAIAFAAPAPAAKNNIGILTKLPNLPSLNGMDLGTALRNRFSLPVVLENDANAAAIGEHWIGASKGVDNSIMITLGTGVGGGLILNGEPFRGIDGTAGEIGHICVEPEGHPCGCGSRGCIEQYASATAVIRMAADAGLEVATAEEIALAATSGNETALMVLGEAGRYLGLMLAGLLNTLNPEIIVVGGGLGRSFDLLRGPVENEIRSRAFTPPADRVKITVSSLGDKAGLLGAARSAFQNARVSV